MLYSLPTARIEINGDLSHSVTLKRGCRQGCAMSATLFVLFIEPLTQAIRESQNIVGVTLCNTGYKMCLYADNILMILTKPDTSLTSLLSLFTIFGNYSGYKLNLHKTQILSFNYNPNTQMQKW